MRANNACSILHAGAASKAPAPAAQAPNEHRQMARAVDLASRAATAAIAPLATAPQAAAPRSVTLRASRRLVEAAAWADPLPRGRGAAGRAAPGRVVERLCAALSRAARAERREVIAGASQGLRREILRVRGAGRGGCVSGCQDAATGGVARASLAPPQKQAGPASTKGGVLKVPTGNVWTIKTASGLYHKVRITIARVAVASRRLRSRCAALDALERLRLAAAGAAAAGGGAEDLLRAVAGADDDLGLSFQAIPPLTKKTRLRRKRVHPPVHADPA
ncbi:unnamed protein product [Prorocentrum cordatum]|uniref:Uncharacterized protein n=1 Tax=Prorocentrum cordatum TaxID=2364126 RepID=A0ABN9WC27_9DINO|nr:unnamed protein product [Polarella glacialis]